MLIDVPANNPYSNVTVTVNVLSSVGTPTTGNVTLSTAPSPSMTLPQQPLNSSGAAVFTIPTPSVGVYHTLNAAYVPLSSSIYAGSVGSGGFSVGAAGSTTVVTSSGPTSTFGISVTFTATVTPAAATGAVTFYDNGTWLGPGTLSNGTATFSTAALVGGSHTITAVYPGDGNYGGSTSPGITQTVNPAATTTVVTSSSPTSTFGNSVTFTATVTPAAATGTVTFSDGATVLGTGILSGGLATFSTAALAVGPHSITAAYGGSANYAASTSAAFTQTVGLAATQTFVTSNLNPSTFGTSVTFTAMVFPSVAVGTVTFSDGATVLGTGILAGGTATFSTAALAGGSHSITAAYDGSASFAASTSSAITQNVSNAATTTVVTSNLNPSTFGASVTFTAAVSASTATGTVTFSDGATVLGTGSLADGTATFSTTALAGGPHSITAAYGGSANFGPSTSAPLTQTVNPAATTMVVTSNLNPSIFGASVTFMATVSAPTATGTVTFSDGATVLGTGSLSGGLAIFSTAALAGGPHTITAAYGGSANFGPSTSAAITQTVNPAATTTVVTSNLNPSGFGAPVIFTATVSAPTATGTVTFSDGATVLGTGSLSGGTATFSTAALAVGAHSITATYGGSANFGASTSAPLTQNVSNAATTTVVTSNLNPSTFGAPVIFTATVSAPTATGTVTFRDGATDLGTGSLAGGTATFSTAALAGGPHSITAAYGGNANFGASTSAAIIQTVNPAATTTVVTSDLNPSTFGAPVIFMATVSAPTATGTVTFYDNITTVLGTGSLSGGIATFSTTALAGGPHSITAAYGGNLDFAASTSAAITQTVNPATTTTVVTSNLNPSTFGALVTFTATVSASTATGTVTFSDGATVLGTGSLSGGAATFSTAALAVGPHLITAAYGGNANFGASTSADITQNVSNAATATSVTSNPNPSKYGDSVIFTATVTPTTATGTVTFRDGATNLGTGTLSGGTATFAIASLGGGVHAIRADYGGDPSYIGSTSPPLAHTVEPAETTMVVTSSLNPSTFGASVTLTSTVTPSTATGTVTFKDGATVLGTGSLSGGMATFSTTALAVGGHSITADYGGSANFSASTSTAIIQTVDPAATTTVVTSNLNPSTYGASVIFTATVTPLTATGTVTFYDGGSQLGTGSLSGGTATFSTAALAGGAHSITAAYGGSTNFTTSTSAAITQTVDRATTTTVVTSNLNPSTYGASVTFTATVTPPTATGTMTFSDGGAVLGIGSLSGGTASFSIAALAGGPHSITAAYGGDANFAPSTSAPFTQNVNLVVTPSAGTNGAISPSTPQTVNYNTTQQFTITPDTGYHIVTPVGGTCGGSLEGNTYTTNAITVNCTVAATFAINSYTVSTSAGFGGSIAPTSVTVNYNLKTTLAVSAIPLYYITSVSGCSGAGYSNTDPSVTTYDYTTGSMTGDCTVSATYDVAPLAPIGATHGIGFGSLGAMSFLLNHNLFGNLFRRRRTQKGSRGSPAKKG
jgi:hypothetical protein